MSVGPGVRFLIVRNRVWRVFEKLAEGSWLPLEDECHMRFYSISSVKEYIRKRVSCEEDLISLDNGASHEVLITILRRLSDTGDTPRFKAVPEYTYLGAEDLAAVLARKKNASCPEGGELVVEEISHTPKKRNVVTIGPSK